jgi:predicted amidohydrolase
VRCLLAAIRREKGDVAANLAAHLDLVARAAAEGCQLAVFPEMSLTGSAEPATYPDRLVPLTHPAVTELAGQAGATADEDFPGLARWSARTAASRPGCPTGARACSPSTFRSD